MDRRRRRLRGPELISGVPHYILLVPLLSCHRDLGQGAAARFQLTDRQVGELVPTVLGPFLGAGAERLKAATAYDPLPCFSRRRALWPPRIPRGSDGSH